MDFKTFEKHIGVTFKDKQLLEKAFTHRSYINENRGEGREHNERLEFLGDAVLELMVTDFLFAKYPEETEGALTAYRAGLVNTNTFSRLASKLGMNDYLLLSKGEAKDTGRARRFILANTFEALVGAMYLDQGYDATKSFVEKYLFPLTDEIVDKRLWKDAKSRLQEVAQEKESITPTYDILKEEGPDHDRHFTVGVFFESTKVAEGTGRSKQEAEQVAAEGAMESKGWE